MNPFVILDRDGVINEDSPDYIKSVDEWIPVPGSLEAIAQLTQAGFDIYVATNQAGVARGKLTLEVLEQIHQTLCRKVSEAGGHIVDIRYCPHHPNDNCNCRKPKPGLLEDLARAHSLDLRAGYYVGDSLKDLVAAESVSCSGVLVLTGKGHETRLVRPKHELTFDDLLSFARYLLTL